MYLDLVKITHVGVPSMVSQQFLFENELQIIINEIQVLLNDFQILENEF